MNGFRVFFIRAVNLRVDLRTVDDVRVLAPTIGDLVSGRPALGDVDIDEVKARTVWVRQGNNFVAA